MKLPSVLTVQSHVAYGHVGNAAALLPLQLLHVQPLAVHTVQFSNHTGHGAYTGQIFSAEHVENVIAGLRDRGVLSQCVAVLSGYLGDAAIGTVILRTVQALREQQPNLVYCCDPVMGDVDRGLFVRPGIPEFHRQHAIPNADIITPNQFEFEYLTGEILQTTAQAILAARRLAPSTVVITSMRTPDVPHGHVRTLAVEAEHAWAVDTPHLPLTPLPNGMGDVFSAIFLAQRLHQAATPQALARTVSSLYHLIRQVPSGARDLPLVSGQRQIVQPDALFPVVLVK